VKNIIIFYKEENSHFSQINSALTWLKTVKNPAPKIQRWRARLNEYHYDAFHIKGSLKKLVDTLSRAFPFEIVRMDREFVQ